MHLSPPGEIVSRGAALSAARRGDKDQPEQARQQSPDPCGSGKKCYTLIVRSRSLPK